MIDLTDYGFKASTEPEPTGVIPARVIAVQKERYELICGHGTAFGRLKTSIYYGDGAESFPTTGDFVLINYIGNGDSQIIKTLERRSFFCRMDPTPGRGQQAVAANFDYVFIMASLNLDFNVRRLERYLALSWQSGATPVVILNKADLADNFSEQLGAVESVAPGVSVHAISAKTGYGLSELSRYLAPRKTVVFLGSSGVGKSSLVNALAETEVMTVNGIREDDSKGRHTTTYRQLIMLSNGAMIIDTPGMRELGMWDVNAGLGEAFNDVEALFGKCKFSDCRHESEPGCAVREAIDNGLLSKQRWNSYLKLKKEARYADKTAVAMREKSERNKMIARINRRNKR